MALIVTPGASNANAFASYATVKAYADERGLAFAEDEATGAPSIIRATTWLSTAFAWKGFRTNGRAQAQAHPRTDMEDAEGNAVDPDTIAAEVVQACCEASIYEFNNPNGLAPVIVMADRVKSERVGPIAVEYAVNYSQDASRPILTIVSDLVSGLTSASSVSYVGSAVRG